MTELYRRTLLVDLLVREFESGYKRVMRLPENLRFVIKVDQKKADFISPNPTVLARRGRFRDLRKYNIAIPRYDIVIGPRLRYPNPVTYTIMDRVDGVRLAEASIPEEQGERFCKNLVRYYSKCFSKGKEFALDIKADNLLYGRTDEDKRNKIYLVDLDPFFSDSPDYYASCIEKTVGIVFALEAVSTTRPNRFNDVKSAVIDLINKYKENEGIGIPNKELLEKLLEALN